MSQYARDPNQDGSPTLQDASMAARVLYGTSVQLQRDLSQPIGAIVPARARVLSHESPEYRTLSLILQGDDVAGAPPIVPLAQVQIDVGVAGTSFSRVVQVGPTGVQVALPAGRLYVQGIAFNNTQNTSLVAKTSHGLGIPTGLVEWFTIDPGSQIFVPVQPFSSNWQLQQFVAGVTIDYEIIDPWYAGSIVGPGTAGGMWPQQSRGISITHAAGANPAQLLVQWQLGGA